MSGNTVLVLPGASALDAVYFFLLIMSLVGGKV